MAKPQFKKAILIPVILLGALGLYYILAQGAMVKGTVEGVASEVLNTRVEIEDLDIAFLSGAIRAKNVKLRNPSGFTEPYWAIIEDIRIDAKDVSDKGLVFENVLASGIRVYTEYNGKYNNLNLFGEKMQNNKGMSPPEIVNAAKTPIEIYDLKLREIEVIRVEPNGEQPEPISLPDLKYTNIGVTKKTTAGRAIQLAAGEMVIAAAKGTIRHKMEQGARAMREGIDRAAEGAVKIGHGIAEGAKQVGDSVRGSLEDLGRGIGEEVNRYKAQQEAQKAQEGVDAVEEKAPVEEPLTPENTP